MQVNDRILCETSVDYSATTIKSGTSFHEETVRTFRNLMKLLPNKSNILSEELIITSTSGTPFSHPTDPINSEQALLPLHKYFNIVALRPTSKALKRLQAAVTVLLAQDKQNNNFVLIDELYQQKHNKKDTNLGFHHGNRTRKTTIRKYHGKVKP